jgi:GNAT superfamily N-acetyltransferase
MSVEIKLLDAEDAGVLGNVAAGVFDDPIDDRRAKEFLADGRHHLAVAVEGESVVGFVSAVHYAHPDKRYPEMWINEVQVAPTHRRKGIARALLDRILDRARELQCTEAWVLTDRDNVPATRLYSAAGGTGSPDGALMFTFDLGEPE